VPPSSLLFFQLYRGTPLHRGLRGLAEIFSAIIVGLLTLTALTTVILVALREYSGLRTAAMMSLQYMPPRMNLTLLSSCQNGAAKALLTVYGVVNVEPLELEVWDAARTTLVSKWAFSGNKVVFSIPCSGQYVLIVRYKYGVWTYSFDLDPGKPCLHGRLVSVDKIRHGVECLEKLFSRTISKSSNIMLSISWAHGPLLTSIDPGKAALAGVVPGYDVHERYVRVESLETNVVYVNNAESSYLYWEGPTSATLHVYWLNATATGNLLHIIHGEGVVEFSINDKDIAWIYPKLRIMDGNILYEPALYGAWMYGDEFNYSDYYLGVSKVIAAGGVGSIYVPFILTKNSKPVKLDIFLLPTFNDVTVQEYASGLWGYCPPLSYIDKLVYKGKLNNPIYISIKLHVIPTTAYRSDKLILSKSYAVLASGNWQSQIIIPYKSITILPPTKLDHNIEANVTINPDLLGKLQQAVVVLDVSYAGGWSGWAPYEFYKVSGSTGDAGMIAVMGANFYLYIGVEGAQGAGRGLIYSPLMLRPSPAQFLKGVMFTYSVGKAVRGCKEYYKLQLTLRDPGIILTYRVTNSYKLVFADKPAVIEYEEEPLYLLETIGFPVSIFTSSKGS
jgi:hypothetical protein